MMLVNKNALRSRLVHAADELPAHQRMQFGILVDRPVDGVQEAALFQRLQMLVKISVAARGLRHVSYFQRFDSGAAFY